MSASIKTLADGFNNEVYPKTKTAAVYDDNDNLLDTILSAKQNSTDSNLNTTAKTVVGAINEIDSDLGSPSSASAVTGNDAFSKISTLNSDLTSMIIVESVQLGANAVAPGIFDVTKNVAKTGYTPIGVVGHSLSRDSKHRYDGVFVSSSSVVHVEGYNENASSSTVNGSVSVLYKKN